MKCLECAADRLQLDNEHLAACSGLTLQEYAIRHHLPLDLLVSADMLDRADAVEDYPAPCPIPGEKARATLEGLRMAGMLKEEGLFACVAGEVRRLDLLLWCAEQLRDYGFRYRQEYSYNGSANRAVARNLLKAPRRNLMGLLQPSMDPPPDFMWPFAICVAWVGELQAGYLFIPLGRAIDVEETKAYLARHHGISVVRLDAGQQGAMLRTASFQDTQRLFAFIEPALRTMPGAAQRFHSDSPEVLVCKEVVFDSAHFITDHPAKCSNLHGGRYALHVKVRGRVDPATGCVVDYGYLKRVVNSRVVELFDHHNLNYVAGELAWRSSTEMLCLFIWERLIDYLPGLAELTLYETPQSWCNYTGPSLAEIQTRGCNPLLGHFQAAELGGTPQRRLLVEDRQRGLAATR